MGKVKINWDKFDKTYEFNLPKINKVKFIGSITKRKHKFAILGIKISATPIKNLSISVNINIIVENPNNKNKSCQASCEVQLTEYLSHQTLYPGIYLKDISKFLDKDRNLILNISVKQYDQQEDYQNNNKTQSPINKNDQAASNSLTEQITPMVSNTRTEINDEIKYIGIKNQGMTCYLNSAIQALFHIPAFRKKVYEEDFLNDKKSNTTSSREKILHSLQLLFCELETSKEPASTIDLTKSFGWSGSEAYIQHDVQEFLTIFLEKFHDSITSIFQGEFSSIITASDAKSSDKNTSTSDQSNQEIFFMINLPIEGYLRINESLDSFFSSQKFENSKKNLQVYFISYPKVLIIQLQRLRFDTIRNRTIKINDYFEYDDEIDLSSYNISKEKNKSSNFIYSLYGVFIHSGKNSNSGHYYAYLKPKLEQWYCFNDSLISKVTEKEVFDDNFGGSGYSNAYLLIYVHKNSIREIFNCSISIPQRIKNEYQNNVKTAYNPENSIKSYYFTLLYEDCIRENCRNRKVGIINNKLGTLVKIKGDVDKLYEVVSKQLKQKISSLRIWSLNSRNQLDKIISNDPSYHKAELISNISDIRTEYLFAQIKKKEDLLIPPKSCGIFTKIFTRDRENPLIYSGIIFCNKDDLVKSFARSIGKDLCFHHLSHLEVFKELQDQPNSSSKVVKLAMEKSIQDNDLVHGDFVILSIPSHTDWKYQISVCTKDIWGSNSIKTGKSDIKRYSDLMIQSIPKDLNEFMNLYVYTKICSVYSYCSSEKLEDVEVPLRIQISKLEEFIFKLYRKQKNQKNNQEQQKIIFFGDGPSTKPICSLSECIKSLYFLIVSKDFQYNSTFLTVNIQLLQFTSLHSSNSNVRHPPTEISLNYFIEPGASYIKEIADNFQLNHARYYWISRITNLIESGFLPNEYQIKNSDVYSSKLRIEILSESSSESRKDSFLEIYNAVFAEDDDELVIQYGNIKNESIIWLKVIGYPCILTFNKDERVSTILNQIVSLSICQKEILDKAKLYYPPPLSSHDDSLIQMNPKYLVTHHDKIYIEKRKVNRFFIIHPSTQKYENVPIVIH